MTGDADDLLDRLGRTDLVREVVRAAMAWDDGVPYHNAECYYSECIQCTNARNKLREDLKCACDALRAAGRL